MQVDGEQNVVHWSGMWIVPKIFGDIGADCCRGISAQLRPQNFKGGEFVFRSGDVGVLKGSSMWFVNQGSVAVEVNGKQVATLKAGTYFGELGLMLSQPRSACVRAFTDCMLLEWRSAEFFEVLTEYPVIATKLHENMSDAVKALIQDQSQQFLSMPSKTAALKRTKSGTLRIADLDPVFVRKKFNMFDKNGDGSIDVQEACALVMALSNEFDEFRHLKNLTEVEIREAALKLINKMDDDDTFSCGNHDGRIQFEEFLPWFEEQAARSLIRVGASKLKSQHARAHNLADVIRCHHHMQTCMRESTYACIYSNTLASSPHTYAGTGQPAAIDKQLVPAHKVHRLDWLCWLCRCGIFRFCTALSLSRCGRLM